MLMMTMMAMVMMEICATTLRLPHVAPSSALLLMKGISAAADDGVAVAAAQKICWARSTQSHLSRACRTNHRTTSPAPSLTTLYGALFKHKIDIFMVFRWQLLPFGCLNERNLLRIFHFQCTVFVVVCVGVWVWVYLLVAELKLCYWWAALQIECSKWVGRGQERLQTSWDWCTFIKSELLKYTKLNLFTFLWF